MTKKMKTSLLILICTPPVLVAIYFSFRIAVAFSHGYTISDMDWDSNGSTRIDEIIQGSDIGLRILQNDQEKCYEYFRYKDGLPIKIVCETGADEK